MAPTWQRSAHLQRIAFETWRSGREKSGALGADTFCLLLHIPWIHRCRRQPPRSWAMHMRASDLTQGPRLSTGRSPRTISEPCRGCSDGIGAHRVECPTAVPEILRLCLWTNSDEKSCG